MKYSFPLFLLCFVVALVRSSCPNGYTQAPNEGACYKVKVFYEAFVGEYMPQSYEDVDAACRLEGAYLASSHSEEENKYISGLMDSQSVCVNRYRIIGLKCTGMRCVWADGSLMSYTNFEEDSVPRDDGVIRCYAVEDNGDKEESKRYDFVAVSCTSPPYYSSHPACWICKKPITCHDYETLHFNRPTDGCVSVYTWPLDQMSAEAACPTGGHLMSIHDNDENYYFKDLAVAAGLRGTIYIGGKFTNGKFEWLDGFPNEALGSCVQMLLDPMVQGLWANVDCIEKLPYICMRTGSSPIIIPPPAPKADEHCPPIQNFTGSGSIYSPNYPVSIPAKQTCEYILEAKEGSRASVIFHKFNCQQGTSLALYDGNDAQPIITFSSNRPPPPPTQAYTATSNILKIIFSANGSDEPVGTGWEAEFTGK